MLVPGEQPRGVRACTSPPAMRSSVPSSASAARVTQTTWATLAMLGRASPLNPRV